MNQVKEALEAALLPLGTLVVERVTLERYHSPGMQQAVRDAHDKVLAALAALPEVEQEDLSAVSNDGEACAAIDDTPPALACTRPAGHGGTLHAAHDHRDYLLRTWPISPAEPAARKFSELRDQPVLSATKTADGFRVMPAAPSGEVVFVGVAGVAPDRSAHRHTVSADDNFGDMPRCTTDPKCVLPAGHDAEPAEPSGEAMPLGWCEACGKVHPHSGIDCPPPEAATTDEAEHLMRSIEDEPSFDASVAKIAAALAARDAELAKLREELAVSTALRDSEIIALRAKLEEAERERDHYRGAGELLVGAEEERQAAEQRIAEAVASAHLMTHSDGSPRSAETRLTQVLLALTADPKGGA